MRRPAQRKWMRPLDVGAYSLSMPAVGGSPYARKRTTKASVAEAPPTRRRPRASVRVPGVTSLVYSTDTDAGITREARDDGFVYRGAHGRLLRGQKVLSRINALVIPPAWQQVWICANPNGHLQATGKDARGRKQYRYHPLWVAERDANKFDALKDFALALPRIRRRVAQDLTAPQLTKRRVLAAVVALIDRTFIRVGGERYRRDNGSFGATTLRNRHVQVAGEEIVFDFRGKSGKRHRIAIQDGRVASVIRRCLEYPGQLFVYREDGAVKSIAAADVNEYLAEASGRSVTSKDFRTWGGTVRAAEYLSNVPPENTRLAVKKHIRDATRSASRLLGNTPAVCRRSYIHPAVFQCYEAGIGARPRPITGLRTRERAALSLLGALP